MNDIQVFDKIIPHGYANQIEEDLSRTQFPWYYVNDVTNKNYGNNSGLTHLPYDMGKPPTDWLPFIKPLVYSIEEATNKPMHELLRIRVGFLYPTPNHQEYNTPHVDFTFPHYTACYYVNDSDGDTVMFDKKLTDIAATNYTEEVLQQYVAETQFNVVSRCSPKKGRLCVFDGLRFHASTKPQYHDRRLVITVNYIA
jgi:hypothetical protein